VRDASLERAGIFGHSAAAGIGAIAEAMFPENDLGAPDWRVTEMVSRTLRYIGELPPAQSRLVRLLFVFVELAAPLLLLRPHRFSRISVEYRTLAIRRWRASHFLPFRLLGDAIKATMTMMYMSHPSVSAYIGEHKACARPHDPLSICHVPDALGARAHT
jgi:hypothetical protein